MRFRIQVALPGENIMSTRSVNAKTPHAKRQSNLPITDRDIIQQFANLNSFILNHTETFYTLRPISRIPTGTFAFTPSSAEGLRVAVQQCIAKNIIDLVVDAIKSGNVLGKKTMA